jgi:hypothetical protein
MLFDSAPKTLAQDHTAGMFRRSCGYAPPATCA